MALVAVPAVSLGLKVSSKLTVDGVLILKTRLGSCMQVLIEFIMQIEGHSTLLGVPLALGS